MNQAKNAIKNNLEYLCGQSSIYTTKLNYIDNRISSMGQLDPDGMKMSDELNKIKDKLDLTFSSKLETIEETIEDLHGQGLFNEVEINQLFGKQQTILKNLDNLQSKLKSLKDKLKRKNLFGFLIEGINWFFETVSGLIFRVGDLAINTLIIRSIAGSGDDKYLPYS